MKKLFEKIIKAMRPKEGSYNYSINELDVFVKNSGIVVGGVCRNEHGSRYSNNDVQFLSAAFLPNKVWNKLFELKGHYLTITEGEVTDHGFAGAIS